MCPGESGNEGMKTFGASDSVKFKNQWGSQCDKSHCISQATSFYLI